MLEKLNIINEKQMDKNQEEWFKGKENLIDGLRNEFKGEAQSMKVKK